MSSAGPCAGNHNLPDLLDGTNSSTCKSVVNANISVQIKTTKYCNLGQEGLEKISN